MRDNYSKLRNLLTEVSCAFNVGRAEGTQNERRISFLRKGFACSYTQNV